MVNFNINPALQCYTIKSLWQKVDYFTLMFLLPKIAAPGRVVLPALSQSVGIAPVHMRQWLAAESALIKTRTPLAS